MRIKSLKLINFRNIKDSTIYFKSKNVSGIYGPNGTGKTSVIEAIRLLQFYFSFPREIKDIENLEKQKVLDYIYMGCDFLTISLELEIKEEIYLVELELGKNNLNGITALKESISVKSSKPRSVYKKVICVENDLSLPKPRVFLYERNKTKEKTDYFDYIQTEIFAKNKTSIQGIILELASFNSFISFLTREFEKSESKNKKIKSVIEKWRELEKAFHKITIINLKQQALSNLEIVIPMTIHTENAHGTLPVCCADKKNLYSKKECQTIEKVINDINKIFPLLVQGAELILKIKVAFEDENGEKYSISIFVKKNENEISIYNESTGTIKLFMLLSALINTLKDEDSILLIDELDVHIFEYLLAYILDIFSKYSKGQLIFTAHNLLPLEKLEKDSIILATHKDNKIMYEYFEGKISSTVNLRLKYLRSQYCWSENNITPMELLETKIEETIKEMIK